MKGGSFSLRTTAIPPVIDPSVHTTQQKSKTLMENVHRLGGHLTIVSAPTMAYFIYAYQTANKRADGYARC